MGATACGLVANLIDWIEGPCSDHGRPRCPTQAVVETLRFFLREGVQWRELRATEDRVCGATLRRRLSDWSAVARCTGCTPHSFGWCAQGRKLRPQLGMWSSTVAACAPNAAVN